MADVDLRREARRRKILANSENRLKKITGVESRIIKTEFDGINVHESSEEFYIEESTLPNLNCIEGNGDNALHKPLETIFHNPRILPDEESISQMSTTQNIIPRHFYILTLPILMNLLLGLCDIFHIDAEYIYLNKIFMPLVGYELYEYFLTPNVQFTTSIISSIILLSNRPYSRQLNCFVQYFLRYAQDVLIYFFVFLLGQFFMKIIFFEILK